MKNNAHVQNVKSLNDKITTKKIKIKTAYKKNIGITKITTESINVGDIKISKVVKNNPNNSKCRFWIDRST